MTQESCRVIRHVLSLIHDHRRKFYCLSWWGFFRENVKYVSVCVCLRVKKSIAQRVKRMILGRTKIILRAHHDTFMFLIFYERRKLFARIFF